MRIAPLFADRCDVFISYSEIRAFKGGSPNSFESADKLYDVLKNEGLNPWIDKNKATLGDNLSEEILMALKQCSAIIPIVTRGYAQSIQCIRELYFFTLHNVLLPNQHCYPMMSETDQIDRELTGKWLVKNLKSFKCFQQGYTAQQLISNELRRMVCYNISNKR